MPNIKSVKKRVLTSEKKRVLNSELKGAMKTAIKKAKTTPEKENINVAVKKIDKAVKKGLIKKNTAARKKAKLMKK